MCTVDWLQSHLNYTLSVLKVDSVCESVMILESVRLHRPASRGLLTVLRVPNEHDEGASVNSMARIPVEKVKLEA